MDCHFIKEKIQQGIVQTHHVSSSEPQADIMTKALLTSQHEYLASKIGVLNVFAPRSLRESVENGVTQ